jgi:cell division protein DivIC
MAAPASRRHRRRQLRTASRRRARGGENRAPVAVQRLARGVDDVAWRTSERARRTLTGDRPFLIGFAVLLVIGVLVISGPLRSYLDQHDRVELLDEQLTVLTQANDDLEQRARDLRDRDHIRAEARERLGYIEPGEVPYVVVPPEQDSATITAPRPAATPDEDRPWFRRLWDTLGGWFG